MSYHSGLSYVFQMRWPINRQYFKGKYQRYFYYHCQPGCKERFRADDANDKLVAKLQEISAKKEVLKFYCTILEKELRKSSQENAGDKQRIPAEINKNIARIDHVQKLMLDGQLDITEYRSIKQKFEAIIKELKAEMKPQASTTRDYKQYLDFGFNLLLNIDSVYVSGNAQLKSQILSSILAEKLVFEEKNYRTLVFHEALALILNASKALAKNKKGQTAGNSNLSFLVETGCTRSNFIKGLKLIEDYMQVGRY